jgi:hypothetical protein
VLAPTKVQGKVRATQIVLGTQRTRACIQIAFGFFGALALEGGPERSQFAQIPRRKFILCRLVGEVLGVADITQGRLNKPVATAALLHVLHVF